MRSHDKAIIHGSGESRWRTPPELFEKLDQTFDFAIDAAADETNHLCDHWLGPGGMYADALTVDWTIALREAIHHDDPKLLYPAEAAWGRAIFFNPPYSKSEISALRKAGVSADDPQIRALKVESWAKKAYEESLNGVTSVGLLPYAPQSVWFRQYVKGHLIEKKRSVGWSGHAALDYWELAHRVSYLQPDGSPAANAGVNTVVVIWGPNPGWVGPWMPGGKTWSYR